ncbi:5-(carboxyamino)imidazole ribonucleotide synthase [Candidatus Palibaumannia cicadellinicola]|uniref:N5-carboxyaminoimidazole ribonucleotide synthase n=1 Tax=Baumannia cicadellinicola subsp. Homalodisca coagulata TaxID=374463 RepID=Q1LTX4_BAUCH|nr:5-(carboxyamino)imidazole ribonucleotide synthase [Candidatus Baumannia cicadellinicola]ABF13919.1 phosphoribosylaminoimidazole carboxylase, ATPase subunit [Baumannia cicadellinicola str. Hc (Homalodisca coagulata)]MBS0032644.1 5-(carboxyamino)imidazole ribonucleotide synthase [Candidatus Baumannia cicadellinicola]MCJ7462428.1 5-(carboxyamino)imidazole ribonucleotide synthase [Candidatus Baumannia cicadellinicola]MCJ7463040.1 5-(carboxyamino)imidazole ribonucleotide synthase [Candidatus Baum
MKHVYVLGDGQLGHMLHQAGEPLGIQVFPVSLYAEPELVSVQQSIITTEIEYLPKTALTYQLVTHNNFINFKLLSFLSDRLTQKQLLNQLNLSTVPWKLLQDNTQWTDIFSAFDALAIVKSRVGGYDGRKQWQIRPGEENTLPFDCYGQCIVEKGIIFDQEISLVGARSVDGSMVFYPITRNLHNNGILLISIVFPEIDNHLQQEAEKILGIILQELNYVGVMAIEFFLIGDQLLINELAPRVHNSGHWTQNGASISQFELHLRAILMLPLPTPIVIAPSIMINLIGIELCELWLADPLVHLHWYNKIIRPRRKVGHLNLCHIDYVRLNYSLQYLSKYLPLEYESRIIWAQQQLQLK